MLIYLQFEYYTFFILKYFFLPEMTLIVSLSNQYVCEVTGNGLINIGDALRLANNVSHPGNPDYILK